MTVETYALYLVTVAVFFAHPPGPSQMLFVSGALRNGVRGALPIMAGDLSANALQILATGFGLASLLVASGSLFAAVKWAGIAYLCWTGIRIILAARSATPVRQISPRRQFRQGFLTSAANPYAVIFFAALFPQFLDPSVALAPQIAILGVTYLVIDGAILLAMGATATRLVAALGAGFGRWLNIGSGVGLIVTAGVLALRGTPEGAR